MKKPKLLLFVPLLLLVAAGCNQLAGNSTPGQNQPALNNPSPAQTQPASPVVIKVSKTIDAKGNAINPLSTFSTADKDIYVTFNLPQTSKKGDVIAYTRYFNGKYVNAKQAVLASSNVKNFYFKFHNKKGYLKGNYTIKIYRNKQFLAKVSFAVK